MGLERHTFVLTMRGERRLSAWGGKKVGGTKVVRAFLDAAGRRRFSGLQD